MNLGSQGGPTASPPLADGSPRPSDRSRLAGCVRQPTQAGSRHLTVSFTGAWCWSRRGFEARQPPSGGAPHGRSPPLAPHHRTGAASAPQWAHPPPPMHANPHTHRPATSPASAARPLRQRHVAQAGGGKSSGNKTIEGAVRLLHEPHLGCRWLPAAWRIEKPTLHRSVPRQCAPIGTGWGIW